MSGFTKVEDELLKAGSANGSGQLIRKVLLSVLIRGYRQGWGLTIQHLATTTKLSHKTVSRHLHIIERNLDKTTEILGSIFPGEQDKITEYLGRFFQTTRKYLPGLEAKARKNLPPLRESRIDKELERDKTDSQTQSQSFVSSDSQGGVSPLVNKSQSDCLPRVSGQTDPVSQSEVYGKGPGQTLIESYRPKVEPHGAVDKFIMEIASDRFLVRRMHGLINLEAVCRKHEHHECRICLTPEEISQCEQVFQNQSRIDNVRPGPREEQV